MAFHVPTQMRCRPSTELRVTPLCYFQDPYDALFPAEDVALALEVEDAESDALVSDALEAEEVVDAEAEIVDVVEEAEAEEPKPLQLLLCIALWRSLCAWFRALCISLCAW